MGPHRSSSTAGSIRIRMRGAGVGGIANRSGLLPSAVLANAAPPPADQVVAKLGGRRLANWVETLVSFFSF